MIKSRMKKAEVFCLKEDNEQIFGNTVLEVKTADIEIYIIDRSAASYTSNESNMIDYDCLGLTNSDELTKGMIIVCEDQRYTVSTVLSVPRYNQVFLKRVEEIECKI